MKRRRLSFTPRFWDHATKADLLFVPLDPSRGALPGFTHRVVIDGQSVGFLSQDHHPNAKAARYFLDKHKPVAQENAA